MSKHRGIPSPALNLEALGFTHHPTATTPGVRAYFVHQFPRGYTLYLERLEPIAEGMRPVLATVPPRNTASFAIDSFRDLDVEVWKNVDNVYPIDGIFIHTGEHLQGFFATFGAADKLRDHFISLRSIIKRL